MNHIHTWFTTPTNVLPYIVLTSTKRIHVPITLLVNEVNVEQNYAIADVLDDPTSIFGSTTWSGPFWAVYGKTVMVVDVQHLRDLNQVRFSPSTSKDAADLAKGPVQNLPKQVGQKRAIPPWIGAQQQPSFVTPHPSVLVANAVNQAKQAPQDFVAPHAGMARQYPVAPQPVQQQPGHMTAAQQIMSQNPFQNPLARNFVQAPPSNQRPFMQTAYQPRANPVPAARSVVHVAGMRPASAQPLSGPLVPNHPSATRGAGCRSCSKGAGASMNYGWF